MIPKTKRNFVLSISTKLEPEKLAMLLKNVIYVWPSAKASAQASRSWGFLSLNFEISWTIVSIFAFSFSAYLIFCKY